MSELTTGVREGRRALNWWWYCQPRGYRPVQALRGSPGAPHADWTIRVTRPRRPFGVAAARASHPLRKIHMVRDVIVGTHPRYPEARLTRWLCGAYTFDAELRWDAELVCSACLLRAQGRSVEPMPT